VILWSFVYGKTTEAENQYAIELRSRRGASAVVAYQRPRVGVSRRAIAGGNLGRRDPWHAAPLSVPTLVDPRRVARRELLAALRRSSKGIGELLTLGLSNDGELPMSKGYVWRNLPLDVGHVLTYFVAHEGHHRGQLVMAARQLGHRLPIETTGGLWQWHIRSRET
jgi:DinB family protein